MIRLVVLLSRLFRYIDHTTVCHSVQCCYTIKLEVGTTQWSFAFVRKKRPAFSLASIVCSSKVIDIIGVMTEAVYFFERQIYH